MTETSTRKRVKVYKLNEDGEWDDAGTGYVACVHLEKYDALSLVVKSEDDSNKVLLESKIQHDDIYQRQQDTLIVWQEPESGADLALSFQEEAGCKDVWEQICAVQGRNPMEEETGTDEADEGEDQFHVEEEDSFFSGVTLPAVNVNNLDKIAELTKYDETVSPDHKELVAAAILRDNYLGKLIELFKICEGMDNLKYMHTLFHIFKNMIMLNDPTLLELMFCEENYLNVVGALEYDPEAPLVKNRHRNFLQNTACFKEVVPIRNHAIVQRIHHTFRVQYIKDVVLPRLLDDMTFTTINSIVFFNNVEIADQLYNDDRFMTELFTKLKAPGSQGELLDLLSFLQELCNLVKNMQLAQHKDFYQKIAAQGLFTVLETNLAHPDLRIRLSCADLVNNTLVHDPNSFRKYLISQEPHYKLFKEIQLRVLNEPDTGLLSQFVDILRILLDTENFDEAVLRDRFLTFFYRSFLTELLVPLDAGEGKDKEKAQEAGPERTPERPVNRALQHEICELLAFFLQHHGYHIKYYIMGNNVASKVVKLMEVSDKHLVLAALRFFRALVGTKDEMLNKHIIKNNLFKNVMDVFKQNAKKYNLLNSAIIELFDFIRKENIKILVRHVAENYEDIIKNIAYVDTFKLLLSKYQQNKDYEENYLNKTFSPQGTSPQKKADSDDESYFFGVEEEEQDSLGKTLVAYGVEEDQEAAEKAAEMEEKLKKKREEQEKADDELEERWTQLRKQNGDSQQGRKRKVEELENHVPGTVAAAGGEGGDGTPREQRGDGEEAATNNNQAQTEGGGADGNAPKKLKFTIQPQRPGSGGVTPLTPGST